MKQYYYNILDNLNISYEVCDHEAIYTMDGLSKVEDVLNAKIAKNLLLTNRQETKFYFLIMPGDKRFKTKDLSSQINSSRLSFAKDELMEKLIKCKSGSASILGLIHNKDVKLLIDEDILKEEYFCAHPCDNTSTFKIKIDDLYTLIKYINHPYTKVIL